MGAAVHFLQPKNSEKRPILNYVHAVLGLLTIGIGFYLAYEGPNEWVQTTGRSALPSFLLYVWIIQVIVRRCLFHNLSFGLMPLCRHLLSHTLVDFCYCRGSTGMKKRAGNKQRLLCPICS